MNPPTEATWPLRPGRSGGTTSRSTYGASVGGVDRRASGGIRHRRATERDPSASIRSLAVPSPLSGRRIARHPRAGDRDRLRGWRRRPRDGPARCATARASRQPRRPWPAHRRPARSARAASQDSPGARRARTPFEATAIEHVRLRETAAPARIRWRQARHRPVRRRSRDGRPDGGPSGGCAAASGVSARPQRTRENRRCEATAEPPHSTSPIAATSADRPEGDRAPQQIAKPVGESTQPEVVCELQAQRQPDTRRVGIDFPRMQSKDGGASLTVFGLDDLQHASRRAHPPPPTPSHRHDLPESIGHERRDFQNSPRRRAASMRIPWIRLVADHPQRRHARVEPKPFVGEHVERPERTLVDRPLRRAKTADVGHARARERGHAGAHVAQESFPAQVERALMEVAVRTDLVAGFAHALDEPRMTLGHPADDEECGADAGAVEQIQHAVGRHLDARRQAVPPVGRREALPRRRCETTPRDRP